MTVLMIDNHDSFVYNIVDLLERNGESVEVVENDQHLDPEKLHRFDTLVISPGPGNPVNKEDRGRTLDLIAEGKFRKILGICFGHQLLAFSLGSSIYRTERIYHGEVDVIRNFHGGILRPACDNFTAIRYHSLAVTPNPNIIVDAVSQSDGTIMAFHSRDSRIFGVQFHPESHYSSFGNEIIEEFLKI